MPVLSVASAAASQDRDRTMAVDTHKPLASLSPTLLARKGGAKPAMRQHSVAASMPGEFDAVGIDHELGWNDMGEALPQAEVVPITRTADARRQHIFARVDIGEARQRNADEKIADDTGWPGKETKLRIRQPEIMLDPFGQHPKRHRIEKGKEGCKDNHEQCPIGRR